MPLGSHLQTTSVAVPSLAGEVFLAERKNILREKNKKSGKINMAVTTVFANLHFQAYFDAKIVECCPNQGIMRIKNAHDKQCSF